MLSSAPKSSWIWLVVGEAKVAAGQRPVFAGRPTVFEREPKPPPVPASASAAARREGNYGAVDQLGNMSRSCYTATNINSFTRLVGFSVKWPWVPNEYR